MPTTLLVSADVLRPVLVLLAALAGGLTVYTAWPWVQRQFAPRPERLLDDFLGRTQERETAVERLGRWALQRWQVPNLFDVRGHLRLIAVAGGKAPTYAQVMGQVVALSVLGWGQFLLFKRSLGGLLIAVGLSLLPVILVRNRAADVRRRIQRALPDMATIMEAEIAAGNPPDKALERAIDVGGPLGNILKEVVDKARTAGRPLFSRGASRGILVEELEVWGLNELTAFATQVDLAASKGAAGPELMNAVGQALIVEYQDRVQRQAESLDNRLLIPTVLFVFGPAMGIILVPVFLTSLKVLLS